MFDNDLRWFWVALFSFFLLSLSAQESWEAPYVYLNAMEYIRQKQGCRPVPIFKPGTVTVCDPKLLVWISGVLYPLLPPLLQDITFLEEPIRLRFRFLIRN